MEKKNIKILIIIIVMLAIYALLVLVFVNRKNSFKKTDDILIIDNISIWKYANNDWHNTSFNNAEKFKVYINNKYYGICNLKKNSYYELYNENGENFLQTENIFAFSTNFNINLKFVDISKISYEDLNDINNIENISLAVEDLSINESVIVDLDNNGINDKIINVSNLDALNEQSKYFNLTYIKLNNTDIKIIINEIVSEKDLLASPVYNIKYIFNVNNNNTDNIILEKGYFSNAGETENILVEYNTWNYIIKNIK